MVNLKLNRVILPLCSFLAVASFAANAHAKGEYFVPAKGQLPAMTYSPITAEISTMNEQPIVTFNLPDDLVGSKPPPVVLYQIGTDANNVKVFGSSWGELTATCLDLASEFQCTIKYGTNYNNMPTVQDVKAYLETKYASAPAGILQAKLKASASFIGDPEGVVTVFKN